MTAVITRATLHQRSAQLFAATVGSIILDACTGMGLAKPKVLHLLHLVKLSPHIGTN